MNAQKAKALEIAIASMEGMFGPKVIQRAGELPPLAVMDLLTKSPPASQNVVK